VLCERAGGDGHLAAWHGEAQRAGQNYFSDGFTTNTAALINDLLPRDRCKASKELELLA
jgi:hypothetical protein